MAEGRKVAADPEVALVLDGRLFVFADPGGREAFLAGRDALLSAAENAWAGLGR